ncbi:hypothetical protein DV515_00013235 [Chloebia gouldiae]|uniref:Uncharacterized protein n=1 Tax=Chloebia gouldiae TaxID=44316 RepID=A0A3L8S1G2_CHLGU|nr:hypothetical protein DV515_00013235 [Chloebia gouldiae]
MGGQSPSSTAVTAQRVSVEETHLRQGAVLEQTMSFCCQPLPSCEQNHGAGAVKKKSPVICCLTLHPHLAVLLTSSGITSWCWRAFSRSPARLGPVWFEWWCSQPVLRLCEDKCHKPPVFELVPA